jgi:hypothetical protein
MSAMENQGSFCTVAQLRRTLIAHFPDAGTVLRRMRDASLIDRGTPGRDGVGSAAIEPKHAALALLAMGALAWSSPVETPEEARRLAAFALHLPRTDDPPALLPVLAGELRRVASGGEPGAWRLGEHACVRDCGGQRWRFGGEVLPVLDDGNGRPVELLINRVTEISPALIADIGRLFAPIPAEAG